MKNSRLAILLALIFSLTIQISFARQPDQPDAAELYHQLQKLNVLGSVLYVAAHPDDENTRLIAYMANELKLRTGYIAMTRGDGGQNLIGPEIREGLGVIRTYELLEARKIDGGEQFFTRANDFGYSKHPDETFNIWEKEDVLADLVWTIRKFRPDVMITRFNTKPGTTHGHHTASAILAEEAFEAAGDPQRFPEQLQYVETWQPSRLLFNTSWWFYGSPEKFDTTGLLSVDVGAYNAVLGTSYTEMAARSRSMHKSQGFGATSSRGTQMEYLEVIRGDESRKGILGSTDTGWSRIGGEEVGNLVQKALREYDVQNPSAIVPHLTSAYKTLSKLPDSHWKEVKEGELKELIKGLMGLHMEVTATAYNATPGDSLFLNTEVVNRSGRTLSLKSLILPQLGITEKTDTVLRPNETYTLSISTVLPKDAKITEPYWLTDSATLGMYRVDSQELRGLASTPASLQAVFEVIIDNETFRYTQPVMYKNTDPVDGEQYRQFEVIPALSLSLQQDVNIFRPGVAEEVTVQITAGRAGIQGSVRLEVPAGWEVKPMAEVFNLKQKDESAQITFGVYPPSGNSTGLIKAIATVDGKDYDRTVHRIEYDHLPPLSYYTPAASKVVNLDIRKKGERIGYIMGAGDAIPQSLQEVGYEVSVLPPSMLSNYELDDFDAIILGVRAFNTVDELRFTRYKLMEYVKKGGNVIVQYNTNRGLVTEDLAPYDLKLSRDRVTVEEAEVRVLQPTHPVLNVPNKISGDDFEGWVQERGLYFPDEWDEHFVPILSSNDPGEDPKDGGLLIAKYGQGYYVYTGYSWFRQLPAGVPGAFRLFTNMISLGK